MAAKKGLNFDEISVPIPEGAGVTITPMGHIVEVQYLQKVNKIAPIKVIDKDHYVIRVGEFAGEVREFEHNETRAGSFSSLRRTFKKLRYLINNNFSGADNELFITLTYSDNMTDTKQLYTDFMLFIKRLKYRFKQHSFDYINVIEPQGRGAWHCHLLLKSDKYLYIHNSDIAELWGKGFTNTRRISNVDNVGAYLTAYLADFEVTEDCDAAAVSAALSMHSELIEKVVEIDGEKVTKRFIKGGRLPMYPAGVQLYRKSKGIVMPERYEVCWDDETKKAIVGVAAPVYRKGLVMSDEDCDFTNSLIYEQYNLSRKICQTK